MVRAHPGTWEILFYNSNCIGFFYDWSHSEHTDIKVRNHFMSEGNNLLPYCKCRVRVVLSRIVASQPVYILDTVVNHVTYGLPIWSSG